MNSKLVALVVSVVVIFSFSYVFDFFPEQETPKIAVIEMHGVIMKSETHDSIIRTIEDVKKNDSIKAVVFEIDSPGGGLSATEDIYLSALDLKEEKPVVTSILRFGASGGYYIGIAGDYIYSLPSSNVGSIGLIAEMPEKGPQEGALDTGRYKQIGGWGEEEYSFKVNLALDGFLSAVEEQRGDSLKLNRSELSEARVYFGREAENNGLVDEIGTTFNAIDKAAEIAGIKDYEVVRYNQTSWEQEVMGFKQYEEETTTPSMSYLYLVNSKNDTGSESGMEGGVNEPFNALGSSDNYVLIDRAHRNDFQLDKINYFLSQIVENGYSVRYAEHDFAGMLDKSKALVIMSPSISYNEEEMDAIKSFVEEGKKVLIIYNPFSTNTSVINSLLSDYGMFFANGYVYNNQDNYGNYRHIWVNYSDEIEGVDARSVLYTSTFIHGGDRLAYTSNATKFSGNEMSASYSVMAQNGNVLAVGDRTFMEQPYCYVEGNPRLIAWIADYITQD
ncbi:MAG: S49 family peptidase [Halobacteriota archaeon]